MMITPTLDTLLHHLPPSVNLRLRLIPGISVNDRLMVIFEIIGLIFRIGIGLLRHEIDRWLLLHSPVTNIYLIQ